MVIRHVSFVEKLNRTVGLLIESRWFLLRNQFVSLFLEILQVFERLAAIRFDVNLFWIFSKKASKVDLEQNEELANRHHLEIK